jgi:uncharacterized protein YndB with AHSA1/START domain
MAEETTLYITRTFAAPRQKVFEAWTQPDVIRQWFAAAPDMEGTTAEIDLRVGGTYRIGMRNIPKNIHYTARGVYKEIVPNERITFTWSWEERPDEPESLVTIEFRDAPNSTEMRLTHSRFVSKERCDEHKQGWNGCFARMERVFSNA